LLVYLFITLFCFQLGRELRDEEVSKKDERVHRMHCMQLRLIRHKELAPQRFLALDACLRSDPRLRLAFEDGPATKTEEIQ